MKKITFVLVILISTITIFHACKSEKKGGAKNQEENVVIPEVKTNAVAGMQVTDISFPSSDGLMISAKMYMKDSAAPIVVMCHQAGFNKYEYAETAPKVVDLGYTCIAIDQRSGGDMNTYKNETYERAKEKKLPFEYIDAEQDIITAVNYAYAINNQPVILWGSSYAAGLALKTGATNERVRAIIAFSPGEYFKEKNYIGKSLSGFAKPVFLTSTEKESGGVAKLAEPIAEEYKTFYEPDGKGTHGSKALWSNDSAHEGYWNAVKEFLLKIK
ncbi:MAG: hypothetical protein H7Y00_12245 [Fimbriimonadaceae bacterium]|nr:hypothetical protein [Chitinophagales bacterium]